MADRLKPTVSAADNCHLVNVCTFYRIKLERAGAEIKYVCLLPTFGFNLIRFSSMLCLHIFLQPWPFCPTVTINHAARCKALFTPVLHRALLCVSPACFGLAARSGRMSTIDLCRQHFSSDGSLWVAPNGIQQTGDRISGKLTGRCEEKEKPEVAACFGLTLESRADKID